MHLEVGRTGLNAGGSRGQHFDYRDIRIGIAKKNDLDSPQPNLRVLVSGKACLVHGAWQCYDFVLGLVESLGGIVLDEKLSRADACLDIAGLSVVELQNAVENRAFISRSRSVSTHKNLVNDVSSSVTVGKRPLRLVIYDKLLELNRRKDSLYAQTLIQRRWGGSMPEAATRVEFQTSREKLKAYGISSPADLREKLGAMFAKLGTEWFRITSQHVESRTKNQSRAETLPLWSAIIKAGEVFFGLPVADLRPIDRRKIKPNRALRSGRGFIASALIQLGVTWKSYPEFLDKAASALLHIGLEPEHWLEDQQSFLAKTERSFDFSF
ncbi:MAG: hypothetical protein MPJ50_09500 [Pirellulales bacterium]|nr:hypothetical protein [Pirellulales bacterium]